MNNTALFKLLAIFFSFFFKSWNRKLLRVYLFLTYTSFAVREFRVVAIIEPDETFQRLLIYLIVMDTVFSWLDRESSLTLGSRMADQHREMQEKQIQLLCLKHWRLAMILSFCCLSLNSLLRLDNVWVCSLCWHHLLSLFQLMLFV